MMIESLVAILLAVTIGYCILLNKRLRRLKSDEMSLKATISELITATEIAERAISGLKSTLRDGEQSLGERFTRVGELSGVLERQIGAGEELLGKLTRIVGAARAPAAETPAVPDARSVAVAAQAFAERARARLGGLAA
jgi:hypothetical protein